MNRYFIETIHLLAQLFIASLILLLGIALSRLFKGIPSNDALLLSILILSGYWLIPAFYLIKQRSRYLNQSGDIYIDI